jgi:two-component system NtrC family response regulator
MIVNIPALRERAGDASLLAHAFVQRFSLANGRVDLTLSDAALNAIEAHPWPGNVRELENAIKRAVIMADELSITADDLGLTAPNEVPVLNLKQIRDEADKQAILKTLARCDGNVLKTAELLGISRPTLYDMMTRLGLR